MQGARKIYNNTRSIFITFFINFFFKTFYHGKRDMENVKNVSGEYPIPLSITTVKFYVDIYISQTIGSGAKAKKELMNVRSVLRQFHVLRHWKSVNEIWELNFYVRISYPFKACTEAAVKRCPEKFMFWNNLKISRTIMGVFYINKVAGMEFN